MSKAVFDWLADSHWTFERRFDNAKMPGLTAMGEAHFLCLKPTLLAYAEHGTLSNAGRFSKRYRISLTDQGLAVEHADPHNDGQPFQTLALKLMPTPMPTPNGQGLWACNASNHCAPDTYDSQWTFADHQWSMHHDVSGPNKDYRIQSVFMRRV